MSADDENVAAAAAPAKSSKVLPLILVFNTLLLTGVLVFVMKRPAAQAAGGAGAAKEHAAATEGGHEKAGEHGDKAGAEGAPAGPGPTMRLDAFVVQVRATEGDRYAHLTLEIELGSDGDKALFEKRMPRVRDAIIAHVSDRTEDEMRGSEGLGQLKESLLKKLEEIIPGRHARGVFITEFVIQ
jgi:flagellar protein FliL